MRVTVPMPRLISENEVVYITEPKAVIRSVVEYDDSNDESCGKYLFPGVSFRPMIQLVATIRNAESTTDDLSLLAARLIALDIHIARTNQMPGNLSADAIARCSVPNDDVADELCNEIASCVGNSRGSSTIPVVLDPYATGPHILDVAAYVICQACRSGCGLPAAGAPNKHIAESVFQDSINVY